MASSTDTNFPSGRKRVTFSTQVTRSNTSNTATGLILPAGLLLTGTNLVFSGTNGTPGASYAVLTATNVTLPLSNWVSLVTNQFSASGQFTFTNGIAPTDPQRYFRLRTP